MTATSVQIERRVSTALDRIRTFLAAKAPRLASALAPGATAEQITATEDQLGFAVPVAVRTLWATHAGSRDEVGVLGYRYLLDLRLGVMERDGVLTNVRLVRDRPDDWARAGVTRDEVASDRWVPVAGRDSDYLVVSIESGRVFDAPSTLPALQLAAASLEDHLETYARELETGKYQLSDSFGGCLQRRRPEPWEVLAEYFVTGMVESRAVALAGGGSARVALVDRIAEFCRRRLAAGKPLTMTPELPGEVAEMLVELPEVDELFADDKQLQELWIPAMREAGKRGL